jgi:hypothetical protein
MIWQQCITMKIQQLMINFHGARVRPADRHGAES